MIKITRFALFIGILFLQILSVHAGDVSTEKSTQKIIIDHTDNFLESFRTALSLFYSEKYGPAEAAFDRILIEYPQFSSAYIYKADCQIALDKKKAAQKNYKKAYDLLKKTKELQDVLAKDVKNPGIYADMLYCLNAMGQYKKSAITGMKGTFSGNSSDLYINLAYAYHKLGKTQPAKVNFCKSRKISIPKEINSLTYQRTVKFFENNQQWAYDCSEEEKVIKMRKYALIIAVGQYKDPSIQPLTYASDDARQLYQVLTSPRIGGFDPKNVIVLINDKATYKDIKFAFDDIIQKASQPNDLLLVFYAGHGFTYPQKTDTYWLTYDTTVGNSDGNRIKSTAFSNLELSSKIGESKAKTSLFFIDACFSAGMVNKPTAIKGLESFLGTGKDYIIITSSQPDEKSIESPKLKHGLFSYFLTKGLSGDSDKNFDGKVELEELWLYIKNSVSNYAISMGKRQTPRRSGSSGGLLYLSNNPN